MAGKGLVCLLIENGNGIVIDAGDDFEWSSKSWSYLSHWIATFTNVVHYQIVYFECVLSFVSIEFFHFFGNIIPSMLIKLVSYCGE